MSGIHYLTTSNFIRIQQTKTLAINIPGNVLVFFKSSTCENCRKFEPIFTHLTKEERRISYAIADLSNNREVAMWSKDTSTPIQNVPHLIFYVAGKPKARYMGQLNVAAIKSFLSKVLLSLSQPQPQPQPQTFMPQPQQSNTNNRGRRGPYEQLGGPEEEDEDKLLTPDNMIPYNKAWLSDSYNKLE